MTTCYNQVTTERCHIPSAIKDTALFRVFRLVWFFVVVTVSRCLTQHAVGALTGIFATRNLANRVSPLREDSSSRVLFARLRYFSKHDL